MLTFGSETGLVRKSNRVVVRARRLGMRLFVFGLLAGAADAQQGTSAIQGRTLDEQNAALPGVTVLATNEGTGIFQQTVTGGDGTYSISNLVPGPYRVTAELQGFRRLAREHVVLTAGMTQVLDLTLQIGALEETVTVSAQATAVDVTSSAVASNISLQQVQALPAISHNLMGALMVVPGAVYVPGYKPSVEAISVNANINGQHYYLDGGSNTSIVFTGSVGTRVMVPSDVIQEVVVFSDQMPAEYGGRNGAVVNVITRSGTNAFQGSLHGYFNNQGLTAKDAVAVSNQLPKPDIQRYGPGFTLGGPIVQSKIFFFGAYEYAFLGRSNSVAYPTSPQWSYTSQALTKGSDAFFRVDHQINADSIYAVRFITRKSECDGDPGCRAGGAATTALPTAGSTLQSLTQEWELDTNLIANYNKIISPTKLNVVTFSFPRQSISTGVPSDAPDAQTTCVSCLPPTLRYLSFEVQAPYFDHTRWEPQYRLEDSFSWFVGGRHNLKFGGLYNYGYHLQTSLEAENGIFVFAGNNPFNVNSPGTYPEQLLIRNGSQTSDPKMSFVSAYVQDKWQATDNLTLNLGLRYDLVFAPTPNQYNPLFADRNGYPIDKNDLGPHVGFAYSSSDRKGVFRGGYLKLFNQPVFSGQQDTYWRQPVFGTGMVSILPVGGVPDPGPASGRLPTDPFLLTIGPNGPVVNTARLNQLYPAGSVQRNVSTVYLDNPNRRLPVSQQFTLGYQRQLGKSLSASVDYVHIKGTNDLIQYDLNPGIKTSTSRTAPLARVDIDGIAGQLGISPFVTDVYTSTSAGIDKYDGLDLSFDKRLANFWAARASYVYSRCLDTVGSSNFQVLDVQNVVLAPCAADRTHILSISGTLEVPRTRGLLLTGSWRTMSGTPLNIFNTGVDTDKNGILVDPLSAGTYTGSGPGAVSVTTNGGYNGARGQGFSEVNLRLGYRIQLGGRRNLELAVDNFNVTNHANYSNPTGDLRQPTFLLLNTILPGGFPRSAQLSAKYVF
jgi:hypothetical protein